MIEANSTFIVIPEGVRLSLLAAKFAKVMFSQVSVHGGGVSAPLHTGIHPLGRHPPAQCMLGYTPPPAQCMLGYGQQADGTHPTGMHSCSEFMFVFYAK